MIVFCRLSYLYGNNYHNVYTVYKLVLSEEKLTDETPIPEHPEVIVFASYRNAPKYPCKVSMLGESVSVQSRMFAMLGESVRVQSRMFSMLGESVSVQSRMFAMLGESVSVQSRMFAMLGESVSVQSRMFDID